MESESNLPVIVIMAGGNGTRMGSDLPKVLHKVGTYPMIVHLILEARKIKLSKILIIVGKFHQIIKSTISEYISSTDDITFVYQEIAMGTGHAVKCCKDILTKSYIHTNTIILSGDVPLIKYTTILDMLHNLNFAKIMVTYLDNPIGYGRIIEQNNIFDKIVEEKDCDTDQKLIKKINCGIYSFRTDILCKYVDYIESNNSQKEFYLTDIISIIKTREKILIDMYEIPEDRHIEIYGVNTKEQLDTIQNKLNTIHLNI